MLGCGCGCGCDPVRHGMAGAWCRARRRSSAARVMARLANTKHTAPIPSCISHSASPQRLGVDLRVQEMTSILFQTQIPRKQRIRFQLISYKRTIYERRLLYGSRLYIEEGLVVIHSVFGFHQCRSGYSSSIDNSSFSMIALLRISPKTP